MKTYKNEEAKKQHRKYQQEYHKRPEVIEKRRERMRKRIKTYKYIKVKNRYHQSKEYKQQQKNKRATEKWKIRHRAYMMYRQSAHRYVVADYIGRKLDNSEIIHHINNNHNDNRLENLYITSLKEHSRMHRLNLADKVKSNLDAYRALK